MSKTIRVASEDHLERKAYARLAKKDDPVQCPHCMGTGVVIGDLYHPDSKPETCYLCQGEGVVYE